jgi:hypothetical protein
MIRSLWLRRLRRWMVSHPRSTIRTQPKKSAVRPRLEQLEDRTLLSNSYLVNQLGDAGSGTATPTGGSGDIRYCIEQANLNPGSTITFDSKVFPASANTTINLSHGELDIASSMTITGPGSPVLKGQNVITISGTDNNGGASRVFDISNASAVVTITGLTITNGNGNVYYTSVAGNQGGDIFNAGNLTLSDDVVSNGLTSGAVGAFPARGGGIFNAEGSNGTTGATLLLNNVIVASNKAEGELGGASGLGAGGGVYNDANATTTVEGKSAFLNNQALGWNSPDAPLFGSTAADAGPGEGGGIYNKGTLNLDGSSTIPLIFNDNEAIGGKGGNGSHGFTPPVTGSGTPGGNGGNGGAALGGGVYNTSSAITLQYINFTGNLANGGRGGDGGHGGDAAGNKSWNGGPGGNAGTGGYAEGGGIYNGIGALNVPNVLFGTDSNSLGNQANGGAGGNGGSGGNGVSGPTKGGHGGDAGTGANAGLARGGAVANFGGDLTFTMTTFASSEANGGAGGNGGVNGQVPNMLGTSQKSAVSGMGGGGGIGGDAGKGGAAGDGGLSQGGAVYNQSGNLSFTNDPSTVAFTASEAVGGNGGNGGNGGTGGGGGAALSGGLGGLAGNAGNGGSAQGGGFYNVTGTVTISGSNFEPNKLGVGNLAASGNGGNGGTGGLGGQGGDVSTGRAGTGGNGGAGGDAGNAGLAEAGAGGNQGSHANINNSIISSSYAKSGFGGIGGDGGYGGNGGNSGSGYFANGYGGSGGNAGKGGNSALAFGGAFAVTTSDLVINNGAFTGEQVIGGAGGNGGLGGTVGEFGHPGGYWNLNVNGPGAEMNPKAGTELAGNGGNGGIGATVYGGAISTSQGAQAVTITNSSFSNTSLVAGAGGNGGPGGLFATAEGTGHDGDRLDINGNDSGLNGTGGNGGSASGGTLSFSTTTAQNAILTNVSLTGSSASGGAGGAGTINLGYNTATSPRTVMTPTASGGVNGGNGWGSAGGNGGSVQGVDVATVNYNLSIASSTLGGGTGVAGSGGAGGGATVVVPYSWEGGAGGLGGSVQGGAVFFSNALAQTTLNFFFNNSAASSNSIRAGNGGFGGNAGASTSNIKKSNVTGGAGGNGGNAQGGGLYILTGGNSVTVTQLNNDSLLNDTASAGSGGIGGAGYNSVGGIGGLAQGGAIYNDSVNVTKPSNLSITAVTMAGDQANGGDGGRAGSGTTPNGGAGGPGGAGGNAEGGALYNGDNTPLTVVNSTLGGNGTWANVVKGGLGARGGNAGTPNPIVVPTNNGGAGGNGGSVSGGNVYVNSNSATFEDDTIVFGSAAGFGQGGAGGGGAGTGGQPGPAGANGTGVGGGYFAGANSTNTVANTIIDLNIAQTSPDVHGTFITMNNAGHNIIGDVGGSIGFGPSAGDQVGVTVTQLNLGPLQDNGGPKLGASGNTVPTLTEALQSGSVAIGTGNPALVPGSLTTDQRGLPRIVNGSLDVGAFQTQPSPSPGPSPSPSPSPGPSPSPSPTPPPGSQGLTTTINIVSIQNSYPGLVQIETVYADVTNANGYLVNEGVVTFQVDGQTIYAPVHNGVATATFATGLLDLSLWQDLLFSHPLTASYGDGSGVFAPSGTGTSLPAIWLDFFLSLLSAQLRRVNQLQ